MADQTERAFQRQLGVSRGYQKVGKKKVPGKGGERWYKNIGLGFKTPKEAIEVGSQQQQQQVAVVINGELARASDSRSLLVRKHWCWQRPQGPSVCGCIRRGGQQLAGQEIDVEGRCTLKACSGYRSKEL
ncbi:hypothetical protein N2152v2_000504 [Parachlorella kessleri]